MKTTPEDKRRSKRLSWLLRHGATEAGLSMDAAGWSLVSDVLNYTHLDRETLAKLVATNSKQRLQLDGDRIRCCQGHSTSGVPVTLGALEASWEPLGDGVVKVWHCTNFEALDAIAEQGCRPQARTHVHCTLSLDSTVGKRSRAPIALTISVPALDAHGLPAWVAPNGVVMIRHVPPDCIVALEGTTRAGRTQQAHWQRRFGLQ